MGFFFPLSISMRPSERRLPDGVCRFKSLREEKVDPLRLDATRVRNGAGGGACFNEPEKSRRRIARRRCFFPFSEFSDECIPLFVFVSSKV